MVKRLMVYAFPFRPSLRGKGTKTYRIHRLFIFGLMRARLFAAHFSILSSTNPEERTKEKRMSGLQVVWWNLVSAEKDTLPVSLLSIFWLSLRFCLW